jgi:hypothetical protein
LEVSLGKKRDLISKITRAKWTGGVVQAVEHLLCKPKALSSNPSPQTQYHSTRLAKTWRTRISSSFCRSSSVLLQNHEVISRHKRQTDLPPTEAKPSTASQQMQPSERERKGGSATRSQLSTEDTAAITHHLSRGRTDFWSSPSWFWQLQGQSPDCSPGPKSTSSPSSTPA